MQKADTTQAVRAHRKVGASTTLNRKYVRRPQKGTEALEASVQAVAQEERHEARRQVQAKKAAPQTVTKQPADLFGQFDQVRRSPRISRFGDITVGAPAPVRSKRAIQIQDVANLETEMRTQRSRSTRQAAVQEQMKREDLPVTVAPTIAHHPLQIAATDRMRAQSEAERRRQLSAKEIKDQAIKKALAASAKEIDKDVAKEQREEKRTKLHFSIARIMLAISCAAMAVMAIVYFVSTNMPDISMRVAAMQTGIRASYPSYVPRGFSVTDLSSENGKVVLNFQSDENNDAFSLTEENSSWDSSALELNYVKEKYNNDYTILREQGLTLYVADRGAAWVNGGVVYKLDIKSGTLTKKQIRSIATSL